MKIEERIRFVKPNHQYVDAVIIAETEAESEILDKVFGKVLDSDGFISKTMCECRVSDGCGEHYVLIKNPRKVISTETDNKALVRDHVIKDKVW